jgi:acetyltransferase-like isoleucine patch superfamily enzyme
MGQAAIDQAPVSIGDGVYIGAQSIVRDGVSIGNRVVIGANCFVNKSIPDNTIVAGIPAKVIGQVIIHPDGSAECCYAKAPTA